MITAQSFNIQEVDIVQGEEWIPNEPIPGHTFLIYLYEGWTVIMHIESGCAVSGSMLAELASIKANERLQTLRDQNRLLHTLDLKARLFHIYKEWVFCRAELMCQPDGLAMPPFTPPFFH